MHLNISIFYITLYYKIIFVVIVKLLTDLKLEHLITILKLFLFKTCGTVLLNDCL